MSSEANALPELSDESLTPTHAVKAVDEYGNTRDVHVAGESPLTIKVDGREVVTLMTLGTRQRRWRSDICAIKSSSTK